MSVRAQLTQEFVELLNSISSGVHWTNRLPSNPPRLVRTDPPFEPTHADLLADLEELDEDLDELNNQVNAMAENN